MKRRQAGVYDGALSWVASHWIVHAAERSSMFSSGTDAVCAVFKTAQSLKIAICWKASGHNKGQADGNRLAMHPLARS
jgi:hypothetical protein